MHVLFRLLACLPLSVLHNLGTLLGWLAWLASPAYRRHLHQNLTQAGLGMYKAEAISAAGQAVAELPKIWLRPSHEIMERIVRVSGHEHIEAAWAAGHGTLYLTPHLGCFEITAQAYAQRFGQKQPVTVLFRPARQPWLRELVANARNRPGLSTAPTTLAGVKQLIKALKAGQAVGLLPDQVPPAGQGIWAPFFGRDAYTMTLPARLAHSGGARVVLIWGERLSWGLGYLVRVRPLGPAIGDTLSTDAHEAARQINQAMETLVRECPPQYLWSYARYKPPHGQAGADAGPGMTTPSR